MTCFTFPIAITLIKAINTSEGTENVFNYFPSFYHCSPTVHSQYCPQSDTVKMEIPSGSMTLRFSGGSLCPPRTLTLSTSSFISFPLVYSTSPASLLTLTQTCQDTSHLGAWHQLSTLLTDTLTGYSSTFFKILLKHHLLSKAYPACFHLKLQSSSLKPPSPFACSMPAIPRSTYHHVTNCTLFVLLSM